MPLVEPVIRPPRRKASCSRLPSGVPRTPAPSAGPTGGNYAKGTNVTRRSDGALEELAKRELKAEGPLFLSLMLLPGTALHREGRVGVSTLAGPLEILEEARD